MHGNLPATVRCRSLTESDEKNGTDEILSKRWDFVFVFALCQRKRKMTRILRTGRSAGSLSFGFRKIVGNWYRKSAMAFPENLAFVGAIKDGFFPRAETSAAGQ